ncbi:hypothetical protein ACGC1H_000335 [Rhizoctonia solani]
MKDLYFNTLDYLLSSVASRSHRLSSLLTENCRYADTAGQDTDLVDISWGALYELIKKVALKDLLLAEDVDGPWLPPSKLSQLIMSATPYLETLRIHSWDFDIACCVALTSHSITDSASPPGIINMHISGSRIQDDCAFTDMVLSHSETIQKMVFGGVIRRSVSDTFEGATLAYGPVVSILKSHIQNFQLVEYDFNPPEFEEAPWQLW